MIRTDRTMTIQLFSKIRRMREKKASRIPKERPVVTERASRIRKTRLMRIHLRNLHRAAFNRQRAAFNRRRTAFNLWFKTLDTA